MYTQGPAWAAGPGSFALGEWSGKPNPRGDRIVFYVSGNGVGPHDASRGLDGQTQFP